MKRDVMTLILLSMTIGIASANMITVDDSGGADYTRIQDATSAANTGDTIDVRSGIYYENVNIDKYITLHGVDTGDGIPIIDARKGTYAIKLATDGIIIDRFAIMNSSPPFYGGAIYINSSNNTIINNTVYDNTNGIFIFSDIQNFITNNTISRNNISNNIHGINIWNSQNNMVKDNIILDNTYGIELVSSPMNVLTNNHVYNNYYGMEFRIGQGNILRNNIMFDNVINYNSLDRCWLPCQDVDTSNLVNGKPIYYFSYANDIVIDESSNAGIIYCYHCNNVTIKNLIFKNNGVGIFFQESINSKIQNNYINDNRIGIDFENSNFNTINNNNITDNYIRGIYFDYLLYTEKSHDNYIYNNIIGSSNIMSGANKWNITNTVGENIIGGSYLGGNYWTKLDGTGFSQTCINRGDGICDSDYTLDPNNIDYLPLTNNLPISSDATSPITAINRIGDRNTGDWFASHVNINFTATDDISGVQRTEYRLSTSGSWITYIDTFTINTEGDTPIQYRSIDNAGNVEPINSSIIRIDTISPTITVTGVMNGVIYNTNVTPIISVVDTNLISQSVTLNGAPYTSGTEISDNGNYWLNTTADDVVGHIVNSNISFTIDKSWIPVGCTGSQIYPCGIVANYNILP